MFYPNTTTVVNSILHNHCVINLISFFDHCICSYSIKLKSFHLSKTKIQIPILIAALRSQINKYFLEENISFTEFKMFINQTIFIPCCYEKFIQPHSTSTGVLSRSLSVMVLPNVNSWRLIFSRTRYKVIQERPTISWTRFIFYLNIK